MDEVRKIVIEKTEERRPKSDLSFEEELNSLPLSQFKTRVRGMKIQPIDEKVDFLLTAINVLLRKIEALQDRTEGVGGVGIKC